jgi:RimJ/RimL family protein N-acetyltransferase/acyl carrier protein
MSLVPHPLLESHHLRLRIVSPPDYPFLYQLAVGTPQAYRWRFRTIQPSFEEFVNSYLRQGIFRHFVVEQTKVQRPVGYAVCYAADIGNGRAYIGLQGSPQYANRGILIGAGRMLIDYLFTEFEFQKLYADCPGFVFDSFASGLGGAFVEEGRLRNHERFRGRWWDLHILALYRKDWLNSPRGDRFVGAVQANESGQGVTFEQFVAALMVEFDLDQYEITESTSLTELAFDSVQIYELLCLIEEAGTPVNDVAVQALATVGDMHRIYLESITAS